MDKCDLLCHNCHICRKPLGLARNEEYERPAPPPPRALSMTKNAIYLRARAAKRKREAEADQTAEEHARALVPPKAASVVLKASKGRCAFLDFLNKE